MSLLEELIPLAPASVGVQGRMAYKLRSHLWLELWRNGELFSVYLQPNAETHDARDCIELYSNIDQLTAECVLQEIAARFPEEFERIINGKSR